MSAERKDAPEIFTIGVYGFTVDRFFDALQSAGIDTFCDVRRRRGLRGSEYAFANAARLQKGLEERGIRYRHVLELAPSQALRDEQAEADRAARVAKRERTGLAPEFISAYRDSCLSGFDSSAFLAELGSDPRRIVFFCVEREPAACHRSLAAERLAEDLGTRVTHLVP